MHFNYFKWLNWIEYAVFRRWHCTAARLRGIHDLQSESVSAIVFSFTFTFDSMSCSWFTAHFQHSLSQIRWVLWTRVLILFKIKFYKIRISTESWRNWFHKSKMITSRRKIIKKIDAKKFDFIHIFFDFPNRHSSNI